MRTPNAVFTPGQLPIKPGNVYASRGDVETQFKKAMDRGFVPVVYGDFGVGKTSMVRFLLLERDWKKQLVNVESAAGKSIEDIIAQCLEALGYATQRKRTQNNVESATKEFEIQGALGSYARIQARKIAGSGKETTIEEELVVTSPTDSKVLHLCDEAGLVLIVDEMHKATTKLADGLAQLIKAYGNANCQRFRIVLLGTSADPSKVVRRDPGIDRLLRRFA